MYIHIYSLTKYGLKGSYSFTAGDVTSPALSGSPSGVPPGSPRLSISQSFPTIQCLSISLKIQQLVFLLEKIIGFTLTFEFEVSSLKIPSHFDLYFLYNSIFKYPLNFDFQMSFKLRSKNIPSHFDLNVSFEFRFQTVL